MRTTSVAWTTALASIAFSCVVGLPLAAAWTRLGEETVRSTEASTIHQSLQYRPPESVETRPKQTTVVHPVYPKDFTGETPAGAVFAQLLIGLEGNVVDVRVINGLHPLFDRAAVDAWRQWKYEPAKYRGTPVYSTIYTGSSFSKEIPK